MLVLCCSSCLLIASSLTRQLYFPVLQTLALGKKPWAVLLITKVEQQVLIPPCDDNIICT